MARSVSSSVLPTRGAPRNPLSSTVGPGAKAPVRPIANPRGRVASGGLSKSVGPAAQRNARAASRPPSRGESERPPSREGPTKTPVAAKLKRPAWDTKGRLEDMELAYQELKERLEGTTSEKENMNDLLASERARCILSGWQS